MSAAELKPCPCCNHQFPVAESFIIEACVRCIECGLKVTRPHGQYADIGTEKAIKAWNRRSQPAAQSQWDYEFLSKRLSRVAKLVGVPMPDMSHEHIAECAGTILGDIARKLQAQSLTDPDIQRIFLANGFTIKPGAPDLKPYVYEAARALLAENDRVKS